ncbi:MAG: hypothetical protein ACK4IY_02055 [Chitinophagales bacterium]
MPLNNKLFIVLLLNCASILLPFAQSPQLEICTQSYQTQLRGISIADDASVWVSGSNGYIGRSVNNGSSWKFQVIPGFEKAEFRDIHAFDSLSAIVMSSVQPAAILKTTDGGKRWKTCFVSDDPNIFLDGFDFWNTERGICIGDPINHHFYLIETTNGGDTWQMVDDLKMPEIQEGTAAFAASGNGIQCKPGGKVFFVTGGNSALLFSSDDFGKSWKAEETPMVSGFASSGIFALEVLNNFTTYIVGGDYTQSSNTDNNFFYKTRQGNEWKAASIPPSGYRSCVKFIGNDKIICCGVNGVDVASIKTYRFRNISPATYHTIAYNTKNKQVYLAGSDGKVARLIY